MANLTTLSTKFPPLYLGCWEQPCDRSVNAPANLVELCIILFPCHARICTRAHKPLLPLSGFRANMRTGRPKWQMGISWNIQLYSVDMAVPSYDP